MGFEPTPLRNGALSHRLRPLGHTVHVMLPRCEHHGFCHWLVRGWRGQVRPPNTIAGVHNTRCPFTSRILSRKFSLVTRVSLMRLTRFPWPRKDDTHRSVTAFFSRFPWPRKDDTHRSVTGFSRVVDANRFARQAACSVYVEGILWLVSSRL